MKLKALLSSIACLVLTACSAQGQAPATQFEISFPASIQAQPITGRVFVFIAKDGSREPRSQDAEFLGLDVQEWKPGAPARNSREEILRWM